MNERHVAERHRSSFLAPYPENASFSHRFLTRAEDHRQRQPASQPASNLIHSDVEKTQQSHVS